MEEDLLIPIHILHDEDLTPNEKIYFATYLMHNNNIRLAEQYLFDFSANQLRKARNGLKEKGYIKTFKKTEEELKEITIIKSHKGLKCDWCGKECYILQKHHYPIPAILGGTKIVEICPNCHYTYHALEGDLSD